MEEKIKARLKEIEAEFTRAQKQANEIQVLILKLDGEYAGLKKILEKEK